MALRRLQIKRTDVFGWNDSGIVALGLAVRYPALVRNVAIIGAGYSPEAETADFKKRLAALQPDNEHIKPFHDSYKQVAPQPANWPVVIEKVKAMRQGFKGWPKTSLRSLKAPLLVMLGDRDFMRHGHAIEFFQMVPDGGAAGQRPFCTADASRLAAAHVD